jgi:CHAT domain
MNQMVVVRLSGVGPRRTLHVALDRSPFDLPGDQPDMPLRCGPGVLATFSEDPPSTDVVQTVGKKLLSSLGRHPTVKSAIQAALAQQGGCPIYLRLDTIEAAEFPWESLFDASRKRFLALSPEFPIGRIIPAVYQTSTRYIAQPVRMVVVLSATGVDATGEWGSLAAAIGGTKLDVRVKVVVGQRDLFQAIKADTPKWADVFPLSGEPAIAKQLEDFDPHFVHFFCHGTARPDPLLELATPIAHAARTSDVQLGPAWFKGRGRPLLGTLNCCVGASDGDGVRGLAAKLVAEANYPAAIGMREPIEATDAHVFASNFYGTVFNELEAVFAGGQPRPVEWAGPLCAARQALRTAHAGGLPPDPAAARHRRWTVPILCQAPGSLTIDPVAVDPGHGEEEKAAKVMELNVLADLRQRVDPNQAVVIAQQMVNIRDQLAAPV